MKSHALMLIHVKPLAITKCTSISCILGSLPNDPKYHFYSSKRQFCMFLNKRLGITSKSTISCPYPTLQPLIDPKKSFESQDQDKTPFSSRSCSGLGPIFFKTSVLLRICKRPQQEGPLKMPQAAY